MVAKLPAGAKQFNVPEMLQSLLAERFKVAIHRETRELPIYALVVGKNGPKMKESVVVANTPPGPGRSPMMMNLRGHMQCKMMNMALLVQCPGNRWTGQVESTPP